MQHYKKWKQRAVNGGMVQTQIQTKDQPPIWAGVVLLPTGEEHKFTSETFDPGVMDELILGRINPQTQEYDRVGSVKIVLEGVQFTFYRSGSTQEFMAREECTAPNPMEHGLEAFTQFMEEREAAAQESTQQYNRLIDQRAHRSDNLMKIEENRARTRALTTRSVVAPAPNGYIPAPPPAGVVADDDPMASPPPAPPIG